MKLNAAFVLMLLSGASQAFAAQPVCGVELRCGSYHGTVYAKDAKGNIADQWDEVVVFNEQTPGVVSAIFSLIYPDGTQDHAGFSMFFDATSPGQFKFGSDPQDASGSGACSGMICTYSYLTQDGDTNRGTLDFSVAGQLKRSQTEQASGQVYYLSGLMTKDGN